MQIACVQLADEGATFVPVILSLMYRIAELYALSNSGRGLDADEGVGSHDDPLPRLLSEVLSVLSSFNQTQKNRAEKVNFVKPRFFDNSSDLDLTPTCD